jgi:hypothetical protein
MRLNAGLPNSFWAKVVFFFFSIHWAKVVNYANFFTNRSLFAGIDF